MELSRREWPMFLSLVVILTRYHVRGTIDVNFNELEYLAARLNPFECRRLIAALHYTSYELPNTLAGAESDSIFPANFHDQERNVDDDIPCIRHLLHWNSSPGEGRGDTHEVLTHRLRQINRNDLADWLGKSAFRQLGKDLDRAMMKAFDELGKEETELPHPITLEPKRYVEEDPWLEVDVVLMATLLGLLGTLFTLICVTVLHRIRKHFRKSQYKKLEQEDEKQEKRRLREERVDESSSEATGYVHVDSDTDTDLN